MKRILVALLLLFPTPALADDATPSPTPSPEASTSAPAVSYTPPPEAYQGVGGWAVVNPGTNQVCGVIVATIETFNAWNGLMPDSYMGCPPNSLLRFQTRATADGNVAGWSGTDVKFNSSDGTFDMGSTYVDASGTTTVKQKLIPSQTATDGWNLSTGLVNIRTEFVSSRINDLGIKLTKIQEHFDSQAASEIAIENWKTFNYDSDEQVTGNLDSDIEAALVADGYDVAAPEAGGFVETVKTLTESVKRFFGGFFNRQ